MTTDKAKLILVIDDDDGVRELLAFSMRKEGYRVETAEDGEEGLRKAFALRPDLMILDLLLPRHGGFEVLRQLQASDLSKRPIIVVTGRYTDRHTADLIREEANVVDLLEKPIKIAPLLSALDRAFARNVSVDASGA